MSEAKDCRIDSKSMDEDEPEEGEIQDDDCGDGSLEDVSSEEDISTRHSDCDSFRRSKYISPIFMPTPEYLSHVSPCHNKGISKIFNRKTRAFSRSGHGAKQKLNLKYGEKTNMSKSELHHVKLTSVGDEKERDNLNMLSDYKPVRSMQAVKDVSDTVQEKENRHDCRNDVRVKRVCRRKRRQSAMRNPEINISSSSKPENETSNKRPCLPQENKKRKLLLKYNKISHTKKKNLSPRREKHKRAKKKNNKKYLSKKISNAGKNNSFESRSQENSLLKRLKTMMSLNIPPKSDCTETVNENNLHSEDIFAKEICHVRQNDGFVIGNESVNNPHEAMLKERVGDVGLEILPEIKKPEPIVITLEDSDSDTVIQIVEEVVEKPEKELDLGKGVDEREVCEKDDEDEDLVQLRLLALQSKSRQKEVPKPKVDDDEVMQLRLAALKSAVLKKFELRKQRGVKTKLDTNDSTSPLSLTHSDVPDVDINKCLGQSNTVYEPDEITTLVDMDVSHTDDEKEMETCDQNEVMPQPVLDSIPLPNTMAVASLHIEHNMQNNNYFEERMENVHTDVSMQIHVEWSTSVRTYENSDVTKFSSDNYLMPDMYNNNIQQKSAYGDPQLSQSSTFPQQHGYHDSYTSNSSNCNLPFSSSMHNIMPAPNLASLSTSPSRGQSHFLDNESQVYHSDAFNIQSVVQNSSNYSISHNTQPISVISTTNEQSLRKPDDFQGVENNVNYFNDQFSEEQQNVHSSTSPEYISSNSKYGVEMAMKGFESSVDSQVGNVPSEEITHMPENVQLSRMIVLDEIGHCSSPETKSEILSTDTVSNEVETMSHTPQQEQDTNNLDEDEELLRAKLLINLARKSVSARRADSTRNNRKDVESNLNNSSTVKSIKRLHPSNAISKVGMSKKINSTDFSRQVTNVVRAPSGAIGGPNLQIESKVILSSKPPASALRLPKANKFSQKFVPKNAQPFDKSQLSNSGKYWKKVVRTNKKQILTKINKKDDVELIKSDIQNAKQIVECKNNVNATFGTTIPTIQVTVPTKSMGNEKCKRKVAESDLNSAVLIQLPQRFVIHLGEDSDSADEEEDERPNFQSKRRCVMGNSSLTNESNCTRTKHDQNPNLISDLSKQNIELACNKQTLAVPVQPTDSKISDEFEKSVDVFLKQARLSQEAKAATVLTPIKSIADKCGSFSSATPQAVRHLPSSQQEEYRRLKQQIAKHEEKKKQRQLNVLNNVPSPVGSPAKNDSSLCPLKITVTTSKPSNEVKKRNISVKLESNSRKIQMNVLNTQPQPSKVDCDNTVRMEEMNIKKPTPMSSMNVSENLKKIDISKQSSRTVNVHTNSNLEPAEKSTNVIESKSDKTDDISDASNNEDLKEFPSRNMEQSGIEAPSLDVMKKEAKLVDAEHQLLSKRKEVIENLTHMNSLLQQIEVEKAKEDECMLELQQMNLAVRRLEEKIAQQRKSLSDMRCTMAEAHKQVARGRSECISLSKTCLSLGISVKGRQYKVPTGAADLMNSKLQQVAIQTKRLSKKKDHEETPSDNVISMLSQRQTPVQNTTITDSVYDKRTKIKSDGLSDTTLSNDHSSLTKSDSSNNQTSVIKSDHSTDHSSSTKSDNSDDHSSLTVSTSECELTENKCEKRCAETTKSMGSESSKEIDLLVPMSNTYKPSEDFVPVASAEANEFHLENIKRISTGEQEESPDYDVVAMGRNEELHVILPQEMEYISPLESLNFKRNRIMVGDVEEVLDPLAIFCPYELMGSCHDEECKYQHQTKHNST